MHSFRSKTHILGIWTPFRCSKTSGWFRTTYFISKTCVSGGFMPFRFCTWPIVKISIGCIKCTSLSPKPFLVLSQTNMPNPLFQSKTHVLGGSMPFHSHTWHVAKTGIEAHLMHEFVPIEPFLVFLQQTCPFHFYQSKTHVLDGFLPFIFAPDPLRKLASGCI